MTDFLQLRSLKTICVADEGDAYRVQAQGIEQLTSCPSCIAGRLYSHGTQEQSYQDTPSHGKPVRIVIQRRRYRCTSCGKTCLDTIADLDGKRQATSRLIKFVQDRCQRETFSALARQVGLDEKTIRHVFQDFVEAVQAKIRFRTPTVLGIDEIKVIGDYRAILTNIERNTVFDILPTRIKADLMPYFRNLRDKEQVEWVTMDMYQVYRDVVRNTLPDARIVVDRFHIQRMANEALEKLRKQVRKGLSDRQRLKLKDERFLLLKRQHDLRPADAQKMLAWFEQFPQLGEAHALKEGFLSIWDEKTRLGAEAACERWKANITIDMKPVYKELTTALRNWHEEIFSYFEKPITNAYTESINRLAKDMNRMGRGYSFDVIRARMLYADKALKESAQIETIYIDEGSTGTFEFVMASSSRPKRRKRVQRVVLYGPYIPTLCEMLEAGYFE